MIFQFASSISFYALNSSWFFNLLSVPRAIFSALLPSSLITELIRLIEFHPLTLELTTSISKSKISTFSSVQSVYPSENLVWASNSHWKARSTFLSRKSWVSISLIGQNYFSFYFWESCTSSNSRFRFRFPCNSNFMKLEHDSISGLDFSTLECVWDTETLSGLAVTSRSWEFNEIPSLSCRLLQTYPPWTWDRRDCFFSKLIGVCCLSSMRVRNF